MTIVQGDTLLVIGGESTTQDLAHSQVEALTHARGTWAAFPSIQQGRHGSGLCMVGKTLYVAAGSGKRGGSPELNTLEKLDWG